MMSQETIATITSSIVIGVLTARTYWKTSRELSKDGGKSVKDKADAAVIQNVQILEAMVDAADDRRAFRLENQQFRLENQKAIHDAHEAAKHATTAVVEFGETLSVLKTQFNGIQKQFARLVVHEGRGTLGQSRLLDEETKLLEQIEKTQDIGVMEVPQDGTQGIA